MVRLINIVEAREKLKLPVSVLQGPAGDAAHAYAVRSVYVCVVWKPSCTAASPFERIILVLNTSLFISYISALFDEKRLSLKGGGGVRPTITPLL